MLFRSQRLTLQSEWLMSWTGPNMWAEGPIMGIVGELLEVRSDKDTEREVFKLKI